jgi:hypothetical protein
MVPKQHVNLVLIHQEATSAVDAISLLGIADFELACSEPYYKIPGTTRSQYRLWPGETKVDVRIANTLGIIRRIGRTQDWDLVGPNCGPPHIEFCAICDNRRTPCIAEEIVWIHFENIPETES